MPIRQPEHVSILAPSVLRRFLLPFLPAALVCSVLVAALYRQDVLHQRVSLEQEAQHVLDLQQELLLFEFQAVQSDVRYLATQGALTRYLSGETSERENLEREYVSFALHKSNYDQIRILDVTGQEIIRVNYRQGDAEVVPPDELQNKATRYYYQEALALQQTDVFVSPFDLNVEHGEIEHPLKPVIRFLTPVFDDVGQKRGLLVLNYLGARLLGKLQQISAGFPGQTMIVNPEGEYLQSPDPNREWGWLLGHTHSFRRQFPLAWDQGQRLDKAPLRAVGPNLFAFQRVSAGRRSSATGLPAAVDVQAHDPSSIILVAFVSASAASAHSKKLLSQLMLMYLGVLTIVALLSLYWARSGEIRRYHEHCIEESESRLRQLSSMLLAAQETERRNLSRDLHDELGQQVTAIRLDLRSLDKQDNGANSNTLLRRAIDQTDRLLKNLHEIATRLRPRVLDDLGFQDAVESFLSDYQQRTGIHLCSRLQIRDEKIPARVSENVYRILQEALANLATHARVDQAEVIIETADEMLHMTVRDAGIGFDPVEHLQTTRLGILGMRERVELLNGQFDLQSTPGRGTQISVAIPLGCDEN